MQTNYLISQILGPLDYKFTNCHKQNQMREGFKDKCIRSPVLIPRRRISNVCHAWNHLIHSSTKHTLPLLTVMYAGRNCRVEKRSLCISYRGVCAKAASMLNLISIHHVIVRIYDTHLCLRQIYI